MAVGVQMGYDVAIWSILPRRAVSATGLNGPSVSIPPAAKGFLHDPDAAVFIFM